MKINLYIANRPPLPQYSDVASLEKLQEGEVSFIIEQTGNHWRKIFSLLAKISYPINGGDLEQIARWQDYRDQVLCTQNGFERIVFGCHHFDEAALMEVSEADEIHLISGFTHGEQCRLPLHMSPLGPDEKLWVHKNLILGPYLDYRQFPNALVERLLDYLKS